MQGGDGNANLESGEALSRKVLAEVPVEGVEQDIGEECSLQEIAISGQEECLTPINTLEKFFAKCTFYCLAQGTEWGAESLAKYLEEAKKKHNEMGEFLDNLPDAYKDVASKPVDEQAVLRL